MPDLVIDERDGRAHFAVRLIPRASRTTVIGVREGALHVRVTAAPVNGAANKALLDLLSATLKLPKTSIRIESGATSPRKRVSVPHDALTRLRAL